MRAKPTDLNLDDFLDIELYPWHSRRFSKAEFRPKRTAEGLVDRYVIDPVEACATSATSQFHHARATELPEVAQDRITPM